MGYLGHYRAMKQAEILYSRLKTTLITSVCTVVFIVFLLKERFEMQGLLIWSSYMLLICLLRFYKLVLFRKEKDNNQRSVFWLRCYAIGSFFNGLGIGLLLYFYFNTSETGIGVGNTDMSHFIHNTYLMTVYAGFIAASVCVTACHLMTFYAVVTPPTLLIMLRIFQSNLAELQVLFVLFFVFVFIMSAVARSFNTTFKESLALVFERDELIGELNAQQEAADKAMKVKTNFLASASHDLRQPLHAIGLFHDSLRYYVTNPKGIEIMDKIYNSTHSLNELLNSMLDISRLDASVVENKPVRLDLRNTLENVRVEYKARAVEKNIQFDFDIPFKTNTKLDPVLIDRVVRNIIHNAFKYTESQGRVSLIAEKDLSLNQWKVIISDTGMGIHEDDLSDVFVEFKQIENPERNRQKGLGLGLSIVKRLCSLMGVGIKLDSEYGVGTQVQLSLPVSVEEDYSEGLDGLHDEYSEPPSEPVTQAELQFPDIQELIDSPAKPESTQGESVLSGLNILVIDDDVNVLEGTVMLLESCGCHVLSSASASKALVLSNVNQVDVIISDYRLPGNVDGLALINEIRNRLNFTVPAILLTGDTKPDRLILASEAHVELLHKPVSMDELRASIRAVLSS